MRLSGIKRIGITYSDYYLPARFMGIEEYFGSIKNFTLPAGHEDLASYCDNYYKQRKIKGIYIEEEKKEIEVFVGLMNRFFLETDVKPEDIDILIYTKGVPMHSTDVNVPFYIQKEFGLDNVITFNVDQTCGASLMSLHIIESMIQTGRYRSGLVLSSSIVQDMEKRNVQLTLLSDGVGLMYIDSDPRRFLIQDFLAKTTGSRSFTMDSFTKRENYRELVKYLQNGADTMKELLSRNNLSFDDIKLISPQNTTYGGWEIYANLLDIGMDKIFLDNIPRGAHAGDVDIIRNLTDIYKERLLKRNEQMISYGLGWGTSWNAALLKMM